MGKTSYTRNFSPFSGCPRLILYKIRNTTHHYKMVTLYVLSSLLFQVDTQKGRGAFLPYLPFTLYLRQGEGEGNKLDTDLFIVHSIFQYGKKAYFFFPFCQLASGQRYVANPLKHRPMPLVSDPNIKTSSVRCHPRIEHIPSQACRILHFEDSHQFVSPKLNAVFYKQGKGRAELLKRRPKHSHQHATLHGPNPNMVQIISFYNIQSPTNPNSRQIVTFSLLKSEKQKA